MYLETFRLPGEAPVISYLLEHFADHWHVCKFLLYPIYLFMVIIIVGIYTQYSIIKLGVFITENKW